MRVLHVVNVSFVLPYFIGDQLDYFKKFGVDFVIVCSPSNDLEEFSRLKDVPFYPLDIQRRISPIVDFVSLIKLIVFIKKNKFDVIIGHTPKAALLAMLAGFVGGIERRIYFQHGLLFETAVGFRRIILEGVEIFTALLATKVVCVSKSVLEYSTSKDFFNKKKFLLLNNGTCNGVDAVKKYNKSNAAISAIDKLREDLRISPTDFVIGFVGRLVNDKGVGELLEAWFIIRERYNNVRLLLVGPFEKRDSLSDTLLDEIMLDPRIVSVGLVKESVLYYCLMDLFILPSYREGFPTVVLEASAMELPVITTRSTGCIDSIIDNYTGLYTDINATEIFSKVDFYLNNKDVAKKHGLNGRDFVISKFQQENVWSAIGKDVLELF